MKEHYDRAEIEIIGLNPEEVITTSVINPGPGEGEGDDDF